jgi:hypothetical protein
MDGLLLCPADAGAGDTVTAYIVFDGVVQTRADFVAAGHTVAWLGIMDHWVGPEDIGVAMTESGGIALDLPGDFSPTTGIACGTGIEDGWPAGTEMAAAAYTGDVAATLSDGFFGDIGGSSCAGLGGTPGYPTCVDLGVDGDNVTMTWRDAFGDIAEDYEAVELFIAGAIGLADITAGAAGSATFPWDDSLETSDFAQLVLQNDAGEDEESRIYFAVPYEVAADRIDMGFDTPAEAIDAGGNCPAGPAPPADPTNQGPTSVPPGMPVGGVAGLALLIIAGAAGGAFAIRKRQ